MAGVETAINEMNINSFIELGPKQNLTSFVQKINKGTFTRYENFLLIFYLFFPFLFFFCFFSKTNRLLSYESSNVVVSLKQMKSLRMKPELIFFLETLRKLKAFVVAFLNEPDSSRIFFDIEGASKEKV